MLVGKERWIMDGNFEGTMDIRLERADTVLSLNYSTTKCLPRAIMRISKNRGKVRADMAIGCPEKLDFSFLHYVATFNSTRGKRIIANLKKLSDTKRILILDDDVATEKFVTETSLKK